MNIVVIFGALVTLVTACFIIYFIALGLVILFSALVGLLLGISVLIDKIKLQAIVLKDKIKSKILSFRK
jgi:hypothetical protein